MVDETPIPQPVPIEEESKPDYEQICVQIYKELEEYKFLSDQIKFNATLFQGFNLILEKLVKIESFLSEKEKQVSGG